MVCNVLRQGEKEEARIKVAAVKKLEEEKAKAEEAQKTLVDSFTTKDAKAKKSEITWFDGDGNETSASVANAYWSKQLYNIDG